MFSHYIVILSFTAISYELIYCSPQYFLSHRFPFTHVQKIYTPKSCNPSTKSILGAGVLPVCAVGNDGWDRTISPGDYRDVVSVGATNQRNRVAGFSSSGTMIVENHQYQAYSFSHLTLQEYLTAKYIDDHRLVERIVSQHLTDESWREVFLLVAGLMSGGADELLLLMETENLSSYLRKKQ